MCSKVNVSVNFSAKKTKVEMAEGKVAKKNARQNTKDEMATYNK
jgi:hypothetical protein